jgi:predicted HTH domain antitoxin
MSLQLRIDYPDTLPDAIGLPREQFEQEAKWALAVKLFEMKRLSSGQAAALVGTDRGSFLLNLHRYGVALIDESEEELLSDTPSPAPETSETDFQTAWNRWFAEVDQLEPSPTQSEPDEYGKALIEKYRKQGLEL